MTALARDTDTKAKLLAGAMTLGYPQKGSTTLYKGGIAVIDAGYLAPGRTATGLIAAGRIKAQSVNAGADGAKTAEVETGIFRWVNGDSITQADVGKLGYVHDDATVTKAGSGKSVLGLIVEVDAYGVWVATGLDAATAIALLLILNGTGGAAAIAIADVAALYTASNVEAALAEVKVLANAAPAMQAVNATLVNGVATINTGITVAAASEVVPQLIGAVTGSTNFASLGELKASRVNGGAGSGTVVIQAYSSTGGLDADAAGAIRVLIFTPQV